jgi:hypothetical protein
MEVSCNASTARNLQLARFYNKICYSIRKNTLAYIHMPTPMLRLYICCGHLGLAQGYFGTYFQRLTITVSYDRVFRHI